MKTINNAPTDRENLEWLIYHILTGKKPCISMDRGRELLGFWYVDDMREWMREFKSKFDQMNANEKRSKR